LAVATYERRTRPSTVWGLDTVLFGPTLAAVESRSLLEDIETLHLDRGYDSAAVRSLCLEHGVSDIVGSKRRSDTTPGTHRAKKAVPLGLRWPVERTNSWLVNFGQLRRNTDRKVCHRFSQIALAITLLIAAKLIDWRDQWSFGSAA
jgi:transposase